MSDLRRRLMEGRVDLDGVGAVTAAEGKLPPFVVIDSVGAEVEPITRYLRDLALSDMSPLTSRSYGYDLLRWFRVLWTLEVDWEGATGSQVDVLVGWMKTARNPQWRRARAAGTAPGDGEHPHGQASSGGGLRAEDDQPLPHRWVWLLPGP